MLQLKFSKKVLMLAVNKVKAKLLYLDDFPSEQINFSQFYVVLISQQSNSSTLAGFLFFLLRPITY